MGQSSTVDVTPVTVEQCEQSGPKGPTDAGADQSYWARFLLWLDAYQVQERHPDRVGLMVTFLVLPLAIAYCVIIAFNMMNAPDPVRTEVLWAASEGPFKMPVRCEAAGGCLLSNTIGSKNPECLKLAQKEETDVFIEYSDSFLDGPSILGTVATESTPVVSVLSEVNMAGYPGADEDGTVFKWNPVFQGTSMMTYVHTTNKTLSRSGRDREEYFNVQLNTDGTVMEGSTPCADDAAFAAGMRQTRIRVHPAITKIVVTEGFSVWTYIGVCSGQYAALISWGALVVAVYDTVKG